MSSSSASLFSSLSSSSSSSSSSTLENITECVCPRQPSSVAPGTSDVIVTAFLTTIVSIGFVVTKSAYDELRKVTSRVTLIIIGGGPIGLLSLYVAARCRYVSHVILYEEKSRSRLLNNNYQLALDTRSVEFLKEFRVDFDNIEGCWDKGIFYTKTGVFLEYLLSNIPKLDVSLDLRLNTKVSASGIRNVDK